MNSNKCTKVIYLLYARVLALFLRDKKIIAVLGLKIFQGMSAFITISVVSIFLSPEESGVFYTFLSLIALQVVVELGMASVLIQASAHEQKNIMWIGYEIETSPNTGQYISLIIFAVRWYVIVSIIACILLSVIGGVFFQSTVGSDSISYIWLISVFLFSLTLLFIPIFSLIEGAGFVAESAQAKLGQEIVGYILLWLGIVTGMGLTAFPLLFVGRFFFGLAWILTGWRKGLVKFVCSKYKTIDSFDWFKSLFNFQWRIAVSWICGYLVFQAIVPITFAMQGPVLAGQLGVTLTAINGLSSIAIIWVTVNAPKFGYYISEGNNLELDALFSKSIRYGGRVIVFLVVLFSLMIMLLGEFAVILRERFLDNTSLALFLVSALFNFYIFSYAIYLRAHKKEPLVINSIVGGILTVIVVYIGGYFDSLVFTATGYLLVTVFIGYLWTYYIYKNYKKNLKKSGEFNDA